MKVLIVEDDLATRRLLEKTLQARQHEVVACTTAEEACDAFQQHPVSLVILDLVLPGMDGLSFCRWIRTQPNGQEVYVLVGTACNQPDDLQAVLDAGANDYLPKPYENGVLQIRLSIAEQQAADLQRRRLAEEWHRTILKNALDGFLVMDPEGRMLDANHAFCEMTGYSREQILKLPITDLLPDEAAKKEFTDQLRKAPKSDGLRFKSQLKHRDGHEVLADISCRHLAFERGRICAFLHNVTERNQAEESLRFRARIQELVSEISSRFSEAPPDKIDETINLALARIGEFLKIDRMNLFLFDESGKSMSIANEWCREGVPGRKERLQQIDITPFQWLQKQVAQPGTLRIEDITNLPEEALAERIFLETTGARSLLAAPLSFGRTMMGFVCAVKTDGGRKFSDDEMSLLTLAGPVIVHVLQRKKTEADLEKLAAFPRFNPNLVLEFAPNGRLSYFNAAARTLAQSFGMSNVRDILPPNTSAIVRDCLATNKPRKQLETTIGSRTVSWSFFPIPPINAVHCYAVETTDYLLIEEQLRQAQKMESIGQLAAGVAHDFNNVLTVIEGHAGLLLSDGHLSQDSMDSVGQIAAAAGKAANLTRQLLTFSRRQVIQPKLLDINEVIKNVTRMLTRILGEDIHIEINYGDGLTPVNADTGMIEQVLLNLAVNARDAMPKGGKLIVSTSLETMEEAQTSQNPESRKGQFVCIGISDTGHGIDPEVLPRIFEPFFTTKAVGKGTGLGLATVYGIIKQHNGWMTVYSEPGTGSTFRAYLPAVTDETKVHETTISTRDIRGGSERILVVEDEPALRKLAGNILQRYGYRVATAETGVAALKVWEEHGGEFDLLLTDMVMPEGVSGRELADQLKTRKASLKVIYSSGYSQEIAGQDLTLEEGFNFLQKPYHPVKLAQMVRDSLDRKPH